MIILESVEGNELIGMISENEYNDLNDLSNKSDLRIF